jgi:hypothetical protein
MKINKTRIRITLIMNHEDELAVFPAALALAPIQLAPVFAVEAEPHHYWLLRPVGRTRVCDSLYAELLLPNPRFLQEVLEHDRSGGHAPTVGGVSHPGMDQHHIVDLFEALHNGHGLAVLEDMFLNYGFVVIMDEWSQPMVYVGNNPEAFHSWAENAEEGTSTGAFFQSLQNNQNN